MSKGRTASKLLHYLERTQWLTPAELEDLQWQRISALLEHARTHVPYYAEAMQQSGTDPRTIARTRSLSTLPVLDRSTIRSRLASLKSQNFPAERFSPNGTGGSTGEPLRFFDDRDESGWSDRRRCGARNSGWESKSGTGARTCGVPTLTSPRSEDCVAE